MPAAVLDLLASPAVSGLVVSDVIVLDEAVVATGAYQFEIGWQGDVTGTFRIGVSTLGGTDTLRGPLPSGFGGPNDDVTERVKLARIERGRDSRQDVMRMGQATITLHDPDGLYNPNNPSSPLAGQLIPMRPVRIRSTVLGTVYNLFRGYVTDIDPDARLGVKEVVITAVDAFTWLDGVRPVIAATGTTNVGTVIGLLLTAAGLTDVSLRSLDLGEQIPTFTTDGSKSVLELVSDLLDIDQGIFFVSGAGVCTYRSRSWLAGMRTPLSSIVDDVDVVFPGVSLDTIRNRATVTRTGGVTQVYSDADSIAMFGPRDVGEIESPYLRSNAQALSLAKYLVNSQKDPRSKAWRLDLDIIASPQVKEAVFARELGDHVHIEESSSMLDRSFHIESVLHEIEAQGGGEARHRATWGLSERPDTQPWQIGISTIGGPDVLTY